MHAVSAAIGWTNPRAQSTRTRGYTFRGRFLVYYLSGGLSPWYRVRIRSHWRCSSISMSRIASFKSLFSSIKFTSALFLRSMLCLSLRHTAASRATAKASMHVIISIIVFRSSKLSAAKIQHFPLKSKKKKRRNVNTITFLLFPRRLPIIICIFAVKTPKRRWLHSPLRR